MPQLTDSRGTSLPSTGLPDHGLWELKAYSDLYQVTQPLQHISAWSSGKGLRILELGG